MLTTSVKMFNFLINLLASEDIRPVCSDGCEMRPDESKNSLITCRTIGVAYLRGSYLKFWRHLFLNSELISCIWNQVMCKWIRRTINTQSMLMKRQ
jgi:hypothetical protein